MHRSARRRRRLRRNGDDCGERRNQILERGTTAIPTLSFLSLSLNYEIIGILESDNYFMAMDLIA